MSKVVNKYTGIMLPISFFVLWGLNSLVLCIANKLFPSLIVLGTGYITRTWAIIHSMSTLAIVNTFIIPLVRVYENKIGRMITNMDWMALYFVINFISIWSLARFSNELGMGVSSWVVVVFLALVMDIAQGIGMMWLEKYRK